VLKLVFGKVVDTFDLGFVVGKGVLLIPVLLVVIVPSLVSTIVSSSLVIVVSPSLIGIILPTLVVVTTLIIVTALLIVSLIWTVVISICSRQGVVLLELWAFIGIVRIASTNPTYSLRD